MTTQLPLSHLVLVRQRSVLHFGVSLVRGADVECFSHPGRQDAREIIEERCPGR